MQTKTEIGYSTIIDELGCFTEYSDIDLGKIGTEELIDIWARHLEKYSFDVEAGDLIENYKDENLLISTPDGFQELGDFYIKKPRNILEFTTSGKNTKVSEDHLFKTMSGWKKAADISIGEFIFSVDGFIEVDNIKQLGKEVVYDWEVLHKNHRYWTSTGLESHNTGKSFELNVYKESVNEETLEERVRSMGVKERLEVFNSLKKGDKVRITYDSPIAQADKRDGQLSFRNFTVTRNKTVVGKERVEKITLAKDDVRKGVKFFLYNRKGQVSMAIGDLAAVIVDMEKM